MTDFLVSLRVVMFFFFFFGFGYGVWDYLGRGFLCSFF